MHFSDDRDRVATMRWKMCNQNERCVLWTSVSAFWTVDNVPKKKESHRKMKQKIHVTIATGFRSSVSDFSASQIPTSVW